MKKILHHHIHKTGGTTVNALLKDLYKELAPDKEQLIRYMSSRREDYLGRENLYRDFKCIYGHQTHLDYLLSENDWYKFVLLRDPVDRVASLYYDWCSLKEDNFVGVVDFVAEYKRLSWTTPLDELIATELPEQKNRTPAQQPYTRMVNYLHNGMCKTLLRHKYNDLELVTLTDKQLVAEATSVLQGFNYVGNTSNLDTDVYNIWEDIGAPYPKVRKLNSRWDKYSRIKKLGREIFPVDRGVVSQYNQADAELCDYASKIQRHI